jgi:hypothetical protein
MIRTLKYLDKLDADENEGPKSDDDGGGDGEGDDEGEEDDEDDPGSGKVANGGVWHSWGRAAAESVPATTAMKPYTRWLGKEWRRWTSSLGLAQLRATKGWKTNDGSVGGQNRLKIYVGRNLRPEETEPVPPFYIVEKQMIHT